MDAWELGKRVWLKSGSPIMYIASDNGAEVTVKWLNDRWQFVHGNFKKVCLSEEPTERECSDGSESPNLN